MRTKQATPTPEAAGAADGSPLLKVADVARRLSVVPVMVYRMMDTGELEYVRVGKRGRRVSEQALAAWRERNTVRREGGR